MLKNVVILVAGAAVVYIAYKMYEKQNKNLKASDGALADKVREARRSEEIESEKVDMPTQTASSKVQQTPVFPSKIRRFYSTSFEPVRPKLTLQEYVAVPDNKVKLEDMVLHKDQVPVEIFNLKIV